MSLQIDQLYLDKFRSQNKQGLVKIQYKNHVILLQRAHVIPVIKIRVGCRT